MITTIDAAGRIVIPKAMRDRLGLTPGRIVIELADDYIRIEPETVELVTGPDGRLMLPPRGRPTTNEEVLALIDQVREERLDHLASLGR